MCQWKQLRCPLADEWIRKLWYIYTMEYYSAIKKNPCESILMRWVKLEPIIQSKVTQKDKNKYVLTYMWNLEKLYKALFFFFFKLGTSVVTDQ